MASNIPGSKEAIDLIFNNRVVSNLMDDLLAPVWNSHLDGPEEDLK